jgi:hypothetical protein
LYVRGRTATATYSALRSTTSFFMRQTAASLYAASYART